MIRLLLVSVALLAGCAGDLLRTPPVETAWWLQDRAPTAAGEAMAPTIVLPAPEVPDYLLSDRIWILAADGSLKALDGARWAEPSERMLWRALASRLRAQGHPVRTLAEPGAWGLELIVESFWLDQARQVFALQGRLVLQRPGQPRTGRRIAAEVACNRRNCLATASQQTLDAWLDQATAWLAKQR